MTTPTTATALALLAYEEQAAENHFGRHWEMRAAILAIEDESRATVLAALTALLKATEFPVFEMDGMPGSGRVRKFDLIPLIEAAEKARALLAEFEEWQP